MQHYRKIPQSTVTPCGNTTFSILSNFIIDDNYKCCNEFLPITLDDAIEIDKNTFVNLIPQNGLTKGKKDLQHQILQNL
jgi:hypothetical protein